MKIVNINDIEDLILAKHEIDLIKIEHKEISERSDLNEFINTYASPKYIYLLNDKQFPFNYIKIYDSDYLFVTNYDNENTYILNKIKSLKYNMENLTLLKTNELINITSLNNIIIYNNSYYN